MIGCCQPMRKEREKEGMEPVAIIGMGCRFPGAPNPRAFWQLLCSGGDAITEVPPDRYDIDAFYDPRPATPGKVMSRHGGFLEQVDQFDAAFFGISPREAARIDPQHRLLLEVAWEAMEDAGQVPRAMTEEERLGIGCFIGVITGDYWDRQFRNAAELDVYATAGSARSGAAGRISFSQDLMGASFAIDAACSSSLVAVEQAVQNLRSGACSMAVAGGVNVLLNPDHTIGFSQGKMMAADGHCKTYDAAADGYVRSEGAGVVVLKLLARALADGDRIYAVIRGAASNNDGHCDSFMAPSTKGQQAGLRKAFRNASVDPLSIDYVEAHGPGTKAGDPVEIMSLGEVLCAGRSDERPLIVGSVKTNIGHTEGAAGVAGLMKAALCLKYGVIPPNLHFHTPSPDIPWQRYALRIPTELMSWPQYDPGPHRAVVCSYGIAGTNTYVIVEEAPRQQETSSTPEHDPARVPCLLPLSAQTPEALKELARRYLAHLEDEDFAGQALYDIATTASLRRTHFDYRVAAVCHSRQDACEKLVAFLRGEDRLEVSSGRRQAHNPRKMAWIFPGQGSQWLGMGRDLLEHEPAFRAALEECDRVMSAYVDWSLLEQLRAGGANSRLNEIDVIQPLLFAIEVALAALWRSWGIEPDAVVGHSMGEVAAAHIAGALSLKDAAWIICARSKLLLRVSGHGAMAAVELSLEQARALVSDYRERVSVAVSNSPHSTVLSGDPQALTEILVQLERQAIFGRLVKVDIASHSPQMDPLRADLLRLLARVQPCPATIPMFSTVTGEFISGNELNASYWVNNLREPVLFHSAIQALLSDGFETFLEMSPHPLLVGAIRQTIEQNQGFGLALASLRRQEDGRTALLESLSRLYARGYEPDWSGVYPDRGKHISLPTYPWQRQRYWNDAMDRLPTRAGSYASARRAGQVHPILGFGTPLALQPGSHFWATTLDVEQFPYLSEHRVHGMPVLACAAYLELSLAAGSMVYGSPGFSLEDLQLTRALFLPRGVSQSFQVVLTPEEEGVMRLRFFSALSEQEKQASAWTEHARALVRREEGPLPRAPISHPSSEHVQHKWTLVMEAAAYYAGLRARGIQHGPLFRGITHVYRRPGEVMARIVIPWELVEDMSGYIVHPALMDAFLQGITPFLPEEQEDETYVPVAVRQVKFYQRPGPDELLWTHAVVRPATGEQGTLEGDVFLLNEQGQVLLEVLGFRLQSLGGDNTQEFTRQRLNQLLYTLEWRPQARREQPGQGTLRKRWLIFSECGELGESLAERLHAAGAECIVVVPGDSYRQLAPRQYEVPPADPRAFQRLCEEVWSEGSEEIPTDIVYLWGMLTTPVCDGMLDLDQDRAESGVLHLLQAHAVAKGNSSSRLWLVTSGVHAIEEQDRATALLQAPLWGLGRTIVYEHPHLHTTLIDIDGMAPEEQAERVFKELWSDDAEDEVALRGERRYAARLARYHLRDEQARPLFRSDGTYLITGGLSGVGLRTAQWMVEQGARHLILLGRRVASKGAETVIESLRAAGASVHTMQVDVSREQELAQALAWLRRELPPLRGVFHSAVVLDDGTLLQLTRKRFLGVRPPRIAGAWNLHRLTLDDPLDYFVLFSSAASLIGSPGQGNYAAASAFLDQLAFYRRQHGYPALCVNWGRWGEIGQATRESRGQRLDARGFAGMRPEDGLEILGTLLRQSPPQVGVMSFYLPDWSRFYPNLTASSLFNSLAAESEAQEEQRDSGPRLTREMLAELDAEQRQRVLSEYLSNQIARVLGHSSLKLDARLPLNWLGIDSLMSVELKNRISADLNVTIPVTTFLQGITFEVFLTQIAEQM
jgi:acyl transferase domain-containing protein/acyl carrier protein